MPGTKLVVLNIGSMHIICNRFPTPVTRVIRVQFLLEQTHVRATSYDCTSRSDLEKRMLLITSTECRTIAEKKLLEASRDTTTAGVSQRCRGLAFSRWSTEGPRKSLDLMVVEKTPTLGPGPDDPTEEVGLPAPRDRQACRPRRPRKCQQARCISGRGRRLVARMKKPRRRAGLSFHTRGACPSEANPQTA